VRQEKRTQVDEATRLHPNDWSSLEVQVQDISPSGFRAECEARVLVCSRVLLEVPGVGPVHAVVAWRRGNRFGAKFDRPIDLARCTWAPAADEVVLSRMLVDRAAAWEAGAAGRERELKRRILEALPVRPVRGAEPKSRSARR
jgi:hypothetical protein